MTGPEQHANTVRENSKRVRDSIGFALAEKNIPRAPTWTLLVPQALDNIDEAALALAERADTLERERDEALEREANTFDALEQARDEADRLREALAAYRSAMRSGEPETEKLRQVGDAALAGPQAEEQT